MNPAPAVPLPHPPTFWQRRIIAPLRAQLTQGATPDRLALSLAVGTACSVMPLIGVTTALNFGVALWLRLNQPVMQILNQLLAPVHLILIIVYVRLGEKIWGAVPVPISIPVLVRAFRDDPVAFLHRFGWTGVHAATAWALSVPLIVAVVYYALRPAMRALSSR
ncbi:MAG TPA: DUF2062 domain-containing protein [Opitutaceae bacterium]|nr:DUF2062 domain-containing protein [Opitutaceae bacterium]